MLSPVGDLSPTDPPGKSNLMKVSCDHRCLSYGYFMYGRILIWDKTNPNINPRISSDILVLTFVQHIDTNFKIMETLP